MHERLHGGRPATATARRLPAGRLTATPNQILALQRAAGNRAVATRLCPQPVAPTAVVQRQPLAAPSKEFDVEFSSGMKPVELSYMKATIGFGGKMAFKPRAGSGGAAVDVKATGGNKPKVEAAKQWAEGSWGFTKKAAGELEVEGDGAKAIFSVGAEHPGFKEGDLQYGPEEYKLILLEWKTGQKPKVFGAEWKRHFTKATPGTWLAPDGSLYDAVPSVSVSVTIEPNWVKILPKLGQYGARAVGAAGPAVGPVAAIFAVPAVLAVAWAKSGHELNAFEKDARDLRARAKAIANLAVGLPYDTGLTGYEVWKAGEDITALREQAAPAVRDKVLADFNVPPGMLEQAAKLPNSTLRAAMYAAAWANGYPRLEAAALKAHGEDRVLRRAIESYRTGPYSAL